jgi:hypothetical protein
MLAVFCFIRNDALPTDITFDAFSVSMIISIIAINLSITFFIPSLITSKEIEEVAKKVVDEKFMSEYGSTLSRKDSHFSRMTAILLFKDGNYFWALSWSLRALNEYLNDRNKIAVHNTSFTSNVNAMITLSTDEIITNIKKDITKTSDHIRAELVPVLKTGITDFEKEKESLLFRIYKEIFEFEYHIKGKEFSAVDGTKKILKSFVRISSAYFFPLGEKKKGINVINTKLIREKIEGLSGLYDTEEKGKLDDKMDKFIKEIFKV